MASTNVGSVHYDLDLKTEKFDRAARSVTSKLGQIGNKMSSVGKTMTLGLTLPILAFGGASVKAASDLNETINKVDVAFKENAKDVKKWAESTIDNIGLAGSTAMEAAALFGDMATSMGINRKKAADMSMSLTNLAGDLASFKNINIEQAMTALAGVFTGETESLKRLGIVMTQANLEAYALTKGIEVNWKEMSQAEIVALRYQYVLDKTKNAQGDFSRTSEGTANQIRITQERFKELREDLGTKLLPIANKILGKLQDWIKAFNKLTPAQQDMALKIGALVAALGPAIFIIGKLIIAIKGIALAMMFVAAHPAILAVTAAVIGLGALAFLLINKWDVVKKWFSGSFWPGVKRVWDTFTGHIQRTIVTPILTIMRWFNNMKQAFYNVRNGMFSAFNSMVSWLRGIPSRIRGAVGSLWGILWNAGWNAINSLWQGMKNIWNSVTSWLGGIGNAIKNLKGPIEKDRVLLADEGKAIMQGLNQGLISGYADVRRTLTGITTGIGMTAMAQPMANTNFYGSVNINNQADANRILRQISRNQELQVQGVAT